MEKQIGKYKIVREIGKGGMGIVYKALNPENQQSVAIKVLPAANVDRSAVERFHRESVAMARVKHPNLVDVYDFGMAGGEHYFVMEYIEGESLKNLLKHKGRLAISECLEITAQIADALENIHQEGMIHRDVKPGNIMITSTGKIKLMDLGLVQIPGVTRVTVEGSAVGTAEYMSPEQISDEGVDTRSDIYSLGVTIYEMLAGQPPFQAETLPAILMKHKNEAAVPLEEGRSDVSPELGRVVAKAMAKDISQRYQRVKELGDDIRKIKGERSRIASGEPSAPPASANEKVLADPPGVNMNPAFKPRARRRSRGWGPGILFVLVVLLTGYVQRERISSLAKDLFNESRLGKKIKRQGFDPSAAIVQKLEAAEQHHQRGQEAYRRKNLDVAIEEYQQAIQFRNDYGLFYRDLALAFEEKGKELKALETWQDLLRYAATSPYAETARQRINRINP